MKVYGLNNVLCNIKECDDIVRLGVVATMNCGVSHFEYCREAFPLDARHEALRLKLRQILLKGPLIADLSHHDALQ